MSATDSANNSLLVSGNDAREAVRHALRLYVGRGRRYSVKQLSNATGVPDRLIECAICDPETTDYRPLALESLLSIARFLGPDFTTEWLQESGQGAFELLEGQPPLPGVLAAADAMDTAEIASRAADGEFDANDKEALRAVGHREIRRGMTLVGMAANA